MPFKITTKKGGDEAEGARRLTRARAQLALKQKRPVQQPKQTQTNADTVPKKRGRPPKAKNDSDPAGAKRMTQAQALQFIEREAAKNKGKDPTGEKAQEAIKQQRLLQEAKVAKQADEDITNLDENDIAAAKALVNLKREASGTLSRFVKKHNGSIPAAMDTLMKYNHISAEEKEKVENFQAKQREQDSRIHAAMSLIKLSGQSTTEIKAALMLMRLKHDGKVAMKREKYRKAKEAEEAKEAEQQAEEAVEEEDPAFQFTALKSFRSRFPEAFSAKKSAAGAGQVEFGGEKVRRVLSREDYGVQEKGQCP